MIICPDCQAELPSLNVATCRSCSWHSSVQDGIPAFLSSVDKSDGLIRDYIANYADIATDDIEENIQPERLLRNHARMLFDHILKSEQSVAGKIVCDVGAGKAYASELLKQAGAEVVAIDITPKYFTRLPHDNLPQRVIANAENIPFKDHFDIAICTDVLEHVINPASLIYSLNRALKMGGLAIIRVPYRENILCYSPHLGCKYRFVHLRNFNEGVLRDTLVPAGFQITDMRLEGFLPGQPQEFWLRTGTRKFIYNAVVHFIEKRLDSSLDFALLPSKFGSLFMRPSIITVVARKTTSFV